MKFVKAAAVTDVAEHEPLRVDVEGTPVALVRVNGDIHAISDICTHELAYLSEGFLEDGVIECPLHGSQFDVRTGKVLSLPATRDIATYPVQIDGDDILVGLEE